MAGAGDLRFEAAGCFKYGTRVKKQTDGGWCWTPIEEVQFGDVLEGCDASGETVEAPVAYVYPHHHDCFDVVTFTVSSGATVATSTNHMMTVWTTDGEMELKPAYQVKEGDVFYTRQGGAFKADPVTAVRTDREECGMVNLITDANICANGIAVSISTVRGVPPLFMQVGTAIHRCLGLKAVHAFARASAWVLRTRMGERLFWKAPN